MLAAIIGKECCSMRKILFLILTLAMPCTLFAQTDLASWANLSALQPGHKIEVLDTTSKKHSGTFVNVSDAAITLKEGGGEKSIAKQDVRSVKMTDGKRRLRHTLIGLGIGAGAGAAITAAGWENNGFLGGKGAGAAVGAIIGGVTGTVVGALLPANSTVYRVSSP
jgi:hypothetical protein